MRPELRAFESLLELGASVLYMCVRPLQTIDISLNTLLGAACMNNSLCLGVFLLLVFSQRLSWQFSAETLCIVLVEVGCASSLCVTVPDVKCPCVLGVYS